MNKINEILIEEDSFFTREIERIASVSSRDGIICKIFHLLNIRSSIPSNNGWTVTLDGLTIILNSIANLLIFHIRMNELNPYTHPDLPLNVIDSEAIKILELYISEEKIAGLKWWVDEEITKTYIQRKFLEFLSSGRRTLLEDEGEKNIEEKRQRLIKNKQLSVYLLRNRM